MGEFLRNGKLLTLMLGHFTVDSYVGVIPILYPLLIGRFRLSLATVGLVSLAYGGMAAIPARAPAAERAMTGQPWSEATIASATAALASDFTPLTDLRGSREHRLRAAGSMLRRFYLQHLPAACAVRVTDPSAAKEFA